MSAQPLPSRPHLYVDLDGTLIASDLLHESVLLLLRDAPLQLLRIPGWLSQGLAPMKRRIAERVQLDAALLPYRADVVDAIRRARGEGRRVVLATASDALLADAVAKHLGLFDAVIASDGSTNNKGARKLDAIRTDAAGHPFCYMSDGWVDLPVWQGAASAAVVSSDAGLRARVREVARAVEAEIDVPQPKLRDFLYGLRLHQWLKNLLVFVPMLPIIGTVTAQMGLAALAMFFAFGLTASAMYVINDLLDLEADRQHARKRHRPFASGRIPIRQAVALGLALLLAAAVLAVLTLPPLAIAVLGIYVVLTTAYSSWLKRRMLVDVFALAMLYTLRILAGSAATEVAPSFWLLGFSLFFFLSLALAKRYVELHELRASALRLKLRGRAYANTDSVFVLCAGLTAGQLAILTLSLYLNDHTQVHRYDQPYVLWLLCPLLLYWLVRVWLKAHRGELHHDPVVFAATDRVSQLIVLACVMLVVVAS